MVRSALRGSEKSCAGAAGCARRSYKETGGESAIIVVHFGRFRFGQKREIFVLLLYPYAYKHPQIWG